MRVIRCSRRVRGVRIGEEERPEKGDRGSFLRSPLSHWRCIPNPRKWDLYLEAVACFDGINVDILGDLVVSVPGFVKYISAATRERFYVKYLEEFLCPLDRGAQHPPGLVLVIDLTLTCEQVVRKNYEKLQPAFGHDKSNAGLCSRELHQFIAHKRTTLPSPSLYVDLCQADLPSKGLSGLSSSNGDGEYTANYGGLGFLNQSIADFLPVNSDVLLQNDPSGSRQHSIERNVSDGDKRSHPHGGVLCSCNSIQQLENNSTETHVTNDGEIQAPKQSSGAPTHGAENTVWHEDCGSKQNVHKHGISDVQVTSNHLHGKIDGVCANNIQLAGSIPPFLCKESGTLQDASLIGNGNMHADEVGCSSSGLNVLRETHSHGNQIEDCSFNPEPSYELPIALKQQSFSSQFNATDDSLKLGWTGKSLCIKCNKGGELLCCTSSDCAVAVHKSCSGLPANFDNKGFFCCPFCSFQKENSAFIKTRELFLQAGENCMDFFRAISAEVDREKQPLTEALRKICQELGAGNLNCQFDFEKAREDIMEYLGARLVEVRKEKQPVTGALRKKSQESDVGTLNCQSDCEINSHQSDKPGDALPEAKERFPNIVTASAGEGGASSRFAEVPSSMGTFNVSPDAEMDVEKPINGHQDATEIQHNQLADTGTITNNGILSCQERIPSVICHDKAVNLNVGSGAATTGNLPDDKMDPYHEIHVHDASKGKTKKRSRNKDQIENGHDLGHEVLASIDSDRIVKKGRHDAVVGRCHLPQGSVENQHKENSSPGRCRSHKKKEQVKNHHEEENEVITSRDTDRFVMRGSNGAVAGRFHHSQDTTGDQKKGNSSPRQRLNCEKKAKKFSNSTKLSGCGRTHIKWNKEEEEHLMNELRKLVCEPKRYPWKKIWESGQHVFQCRRQGDLKDKWRNIRHRMEQQQQQQQQQQSNKAFLLNLWRWLILERKSCDITN